MASIHRSTKAKLGEKLQAIAANRKYFCTVDEYNWDWSVEFLIWKELKKRVWILYPYVSRVYHIGLCGLHTHQRKNCDAAEIGEKARRDVESFGVGTWFPVEMEEQQGVTIPVRQGGQKVNGGWSDPRDHELCDLIAGGV